MTWQAAQWTNQVLPCSPQFCEALKMAVEQKGGNRTGKQGCLVG